MSATKSLSDVVCATANETSEAPPSVAAPLPARGVEPATDRPALRPLVEMLKETRLAPSEAFVFAVCQSDAFAAAKAWASSVEAAGGALDALLASVAREAVDVMNGTPIASNDPSAKGSRRRLFDAGLIDLHDSEFFAWVGRMAALRGQSRSNVDVSWAFTLRRLIYAACAHLLKRRYAWRKQLMA
jgi:hypothetical protein